MAENILDGDPATCFSYSDHGNRNYENAVVIDLMSHGIIDPILNLTIRNAVDCVDFLKQVYVTTPVDAMESCVSYTICTLIYDDSVKDVCGVRCQCAASGAGQGCSLHLGFLKDSVAEVCEVVLNLEY